MKHPATLAYAALAAGILCGMDAPLPIGVEPIPSTTNTLWLYRNANHSGDEAWLNLEPDTFAPGEPHRIKGSLHDQVSSVRWSLDDGVMVVLYADAGAKGQQIALWGRGEIGTLGRWDLKDKLSSWAWYRTGSAAGSTADFPPQAAAPTAATETDSVRLYDNKDFGKEAGSLRAITTAIPQGGVQELDRGISGKMTSLRWNLSPGVVVVFYKNAKATSHQLTIWGSGELAGIGDWKFNDAAKAWAWFRVGEAVAAQQPLGSPGQ